MTDVALLYISQRVLGHASDVGGDTEYACGYTRLEHGKHRPGDERRVELEGSLVSTG